MRIGMVCPYSWDIPGGVQAHVRDLTEKLMELGHHVSVLAPGDDDTPDLPPYHIFSNPTTYAGIFAPGKHTISVTAFDMANATGFAGPTLTLTYTVVWGVSANTRSWWSPTAGRAMGYEPQDDSERFADRMPPPRATDDRVGGEFTGDEFGLQ